MEGCLGNFHNKNFPISATQGRPARRPSPIISRSFAPNSFAEFENDFIAYIDSEHVSLRLFSSKKPKSILPLRKSLEKMWKTALNNIPPSSQNPSKSITCSVVTTPPKSRFYPFLSSTPMGKRIGKWIGGRVGQANAASWAQYMIKILSHR